jgi:hypothetical protein
MCTGQGLRANRPCSSGCNGSRRGCRGRGTPCACTLGRDQGSSEGSCGVGSSSGRRQGRQWSRGAPWAQLGARRRGAMPGQSRTTAGRRAEEEVPQGRGGRRQAVGQRKRSPRASPPAVGGGCAKVGGSPPAPGAPGGGASAPRGGCAALGGCTPAPGGGAPTLGGDSVTSEGGTLRLGTRRRARNVPATEA